MTDRFGVRAWFARPAWAVGGISADDAIMLADLVGEHDPRFVLELGVASGTSTATILYALDRLDGPRALVSVDVRASCYFDPARPVGEAVATMYPEARAAWTLVTRRGGVRGLTFPAPVDLAFVDANHQHPCPLFDVLTIAPLCRREAWVVLHDVDLVRVSEGQHRSRGPEWLFHAWPFAKVAGTGDASNLGAIQLPASLAALRPITAGLLKRPREASPEDLAAYGPIGL